MQVHQAPMHMNNRRICQKGIKNKSKTEAFIKYNQMLYHSMVGGNLCRFAWVERSPITNTAD